MKRPRSRARKVLATFTSETLRATSAKRLTIEELLLWASVQAALSDEPLLLDGQEEKIAEIVGDLSAITHEEICMIAAFNFLRLAQARVALRKSLDYSLQMAFADEHQVGTYAEALTSTENLRVAVSNELLMLRDGISERSAKAGLSSGFVRKENSRAWKSKSVTIAKGLLATGVEERSLASIVARRVKKTPASVRAALQQAGVVRKKKEK